LEKLFKFKKYFNFYSIIVIAHQNQNHYQQTLAIEMPYLQKIVLKDFVPIESKYNLTEISN
jgi:hypothetical protein